MLLLEFLARRVPALQDARRRFRLMLLATIAFVATLAILTVQALSGESVVASSPAIATAGIAVAVITVVVAAAIMVAPTGSHRSLLKLG